MRAALPTDLLWLLMKASDEQLDWVKQNLKRMFAGKTRKGTIEPVINHLIREERSRRRTGKHDRTRISTWRIWFGGEEILMPTLLATDYLIFLISHQGKMFSALQLTELVRKSGAVNTPDEHHTEILYGADGDEGESGDQRGRAGELTERDVILDTAQIASLTKRLAGMLQEKSDYEAAGDFSSADYLQLKEDIEKSQDILNHNTKQVKGKFIPKDYQAGTAQKKADVIRKLIRQLLDTHLKTECRPLFDHLNDRNCLTYGMKNCYSPNPAIPWKIERR